MSVICVASSSRHFDSEFKISCTVSFQPNVQVMGDGSRELNKFDLGDSDIAILGLKMSKKCNNFESSKCWTSIYGNFPVISEK
jgi:hypothetical protein